MKIKLSCIVLLLCCGIIAQNKMNTIQGIAPNYAGETIEVFAIQDYLTLKEEKLATANIKADSTFQLSFFNDDFQKVKVRANKDYFYIYLQPASNYNIFIEGLPQNNVFHPDGNEVSFFFTDLDTSDVNYKIILFEKELIDFLAVNYTRANRESLAFVNLLKDFKTEISERMQAEACEYFKVYVFYAVAALDNLSFKGNRNKFEKYDFFIKPETVHYNNDRYMEYVLKYYHRYTSEISKQLNQAFYEGVIARSPTQLLNVMGKDYALDNLRLREFVLLKMLRDEYYNGQFPQTNIITILDSLANYGLFETNRAIAARLSDRLLELVPGSQMIDFVLQGPLKQYSKPDFKGKHLYIQFVQRNSSLSQQDIALMRPLYQKYNKYTEFLTVVQKDEELQTPEEQLAFIQSQNIAWPVVFVDPENSFLERCKVKYFPSYLLIDAAGYVVAVPALSPRPNNEYETIEKFLFQIQKVRKRAEEERKRN
ncbi:MAG: hypothetical protein JJT77_09345 [Crocinitomicaceae bacterium]|nr:hypothetical protein [Crocinitomicaceae bacterium]